MRGSGLDLAPSNPFGMPGTTGGLSGGSDTLNLSSRMFSHILPTIPGLEFTYLHTFGKNDRWSRLLVEYVRPVRLAVDSTLYGEIHGILWEPFRSWPSWGENIDFSAGGGYRRQFGDRAVLGVHGFYDATCRYDRWHSSASVGGFLVTMLPGDDAIDLTVNWYGGMNTGLLGVGSGAWGNGTFDGTMTYYHELWDGGPDLQLCLIGYEVDEAMRPVHLREGGYRARVQVATRDGRFRGFYMYENDRSLKEIHTLGVNFNIGFRLENLLAGESPIEKPTPIFSSPRNLDHWTTVAGGTETHLGKNRLLAQCEASAGSCIKGETLINRSGPVPLTPPAGSTAHYVTVRVSWCNIVRKWNEFPVDYTILAGNMGVQWSNSTLFDEIDVGSGSVVVQFNILGTQAGTGTWLSFWRYDDQLWPWVLKIGSGGYICVEFLD